MNYKKYLPEFVYGSIDGTVTTFAIVAAIAGANLSPLIVLTLGIANVLADGFSMASGNYLSERSKNNQHLLSALRTSLATFASFVSVGLIPIIPYIFKMQDPFQKSIILTGITFICIGYIRGKITGSNKAKTALETFLVGSVAALISYLVGSMFKI